MMQAMTGRKRRRAPTGAALGLLFLSNVATCRARDDYQEHLHLKKVGKTGKGLLAQFVSDLSFQVEHRHHCGGQRSSERDICSFDIFPAGLGALVDELGVHEFGLSITNAWWHSDLWGPLPVYTYAPRGLEVWAKVEGKDKNEALGRWKALLHGLGGLYRVQSSTLAQAAVPIRPQLLESAFGDINGTSFSGSPSSGPLSLFYGSLPSDALCSDNLEPFVRSLPCRGVRGVASLLLGDLPRLLQGQYLGLSVRFRRVCSSSSDGTCVGPTLSLTQTVTALLPSGQTPATLLSPPSKACPFAAASTLYMDPAESALPLPSWLGVQPPQSGRGGGGSVVVSRSKGQEDLTRGVLRLWAENVDTAKSVQIRVLEQVPFFMEPVLHEWAIEIKGGSSNGKGRLDVGNLTDAGLFSWRTPLVTTVRAPAVLEYGFELDAGATAVVTMPFYNRFLHFEDFPPNPLRGMEVPPAIVAVYRHETATGELLGVHRVASEALLIDIPSPDFSMPFNVVTLSSTLLAFFLGTMINILVKKSGGDQKGAEKHKQTNPKVGLLQRLKNKLGLGHRVTEIKVKDN